MNANKERFVLQAEFCKAMTHPVRLEIIERLMGRPSTVQSLSKAVGVSQSNLSQHLAVLRTHGLVRADRAGNGVVYSLANPKIVAACGLVREILMENLGRRANLVHTR
jgi:ArsR family transcriptional regulator